MPKDLVESPQRADESIRMPITAFRLSMIKRSESRDVKLHLRRNGQSSLSSFFCRDRGSFVKLEIQNPSCTRLAVVATFQA
jgi:hypothetical protein